LQIIVAPIVNALLFGRVICLKIQDVVVPVRASSMLRAIAGVASSGMAKKCAFLNWWISLIKSHKLQAVRPLSASENLSFLKLEFSKTLGTSARVRLT
jgi:hypothetical protein